ncbi:MAG: PAS domain-containing protein [Pontixanthobacter sp.]
MAGDKTKSTKAKASAEDQSNYEIQPHETDRSPERTGSLEIDPGQLFIQATEQTRMALCMSDPRKPDAPIVYVNEAFVKLTGYPREEIVGRNCRFLQGPDTSPDAVRRIREGLESNEVRVIELLNYRKDGTPFWNALHIGPIFDDKGELRYYYGSQWDVTEMLSSREKALEQARIAEEMQHRSRNLFAILSAIVRLSARGMTDAKALADRISGRIEALGAAHRVSLRVGTDEDETVDLRTLMNEILEPYQDEGDRRIKMVGEVASVPEYAITPVGLALHELATNAVKYGALGVQDGLVQVDWQLEGGQLEIEWVENGGPAIDLKSPRKDGTGSRLSDKMLRAIDGRFEREFKESGLKATLMFPLERLPRLLPEQ